MLIVVPSVLSFVADVMSEIVNFEFLVVYEELARLAEVAKV